jgi:hypothetical protein
MLASRDYDNELLGFVNGGEFIDQLTPNRLYAVENLIH